MADLKYEVEIDTQSGVNSLKQLQTQVKGTQDAFAKFQSTIGAFAVGAFVTSAYSMANALTDISTASGIALDNVLGFTGAVAANGGSVDGATQALGRFSRYIAEAADGNRQAQETLMGLGISLKDLGTLSEQDLLRRTVDGLARTDDNARRTAAGMSIFGKAFASVDYAGVNSKLDQYIAKSQASAAAVQAAGDAEQNFSNAIKTLQIEVLAALKPVSELANQVLSATDAVGSFIKAIVQIGVIVATFTILGRAVALVQSGFAILAGAFASLGGAAGVATNLFRNFGLILENMKLMSLAGNFRLITGLLAEMGGWIVKNIPGIASLGLAFSFLTDYVKKAYTGIKDMLGLGTQEADTWAEIERKRADAIKAASEAKAEFARQVKDANEKEIAGIQGTLRAYQQQNQEFNKRFDLQTRTLRMSEEQKLSEETLAEAQSAYLKQIEPILKRIDELKKSSSDVDRAMIPVLQGGIQSITKEYEAQQPILQNLIRTRVEEMQVQKELLRNEELLKQATEARLSTEEAVRNIMLDGQDKIRRSMEESQLAGLSGIARELKKIEQEETAVAQAARRRVAEQFGDNDPAGLAQAINQINAASQTVIQRRQEAAQGVYDEQRQFSTGWRDAFNEYVDSATNAATQAQSIFQKTTQGMEDMIVNFAKTGKFEWKSFVASIAEELLRNNIKKLLLSTFGSFGGGGSGGLFGGTIIPGILAGGGPVANNRPYIVGEQGPELFVPNSAGNMTPNSALGGTTQITYNINAVDAPSFQALVAQDPRFIYAVTEQGRRSFAGAR